MRLFDSIAAIGHHLKRIADNLQDITTPIEAFRRAAYFLRDEKKAREEYDRVVRKLTRAQLAEIRRRVPRDSRAQSPGERSKMSDMIVTNYAGRSFTVHVVHKGDRYGLNDRLTHDRSEPMIEFYDRTYMEKPAFQPRGQFVARYNARTIAGLTREGGLCLDGGVSEWAIEGPILIPVIALAQKLVR